MKGKKELPYGSIVALVTPFDKYGRVDCKKIKQLVGWHKASGTVGIVACGTTGEGATLTDAEKRLVTETCVTAADGEIFVLAGSGSNDTAKATELSRELSKTGADGLLVVTPFYNRTNADGLFRHFESVADAVDLPIMLYNVPSRTGCEISFDVAKKLKSHPNVAGIKEASGNLSFAAKIATLTDENFSLYCGNDDLILPYLSIGAKGVVSVWANFTPTKVAELWTAWQVGDVERARKIQLRYLDFINLLFAEPNPIPIKTLLNMAGFNVGLPRLPLGRLSAKTRQELKKQVLGLGESLK